MSYGVGTRVGVSAAIASLLSLSSGASGGFVTYTISPTWNPSDKGTNVTLSNSNLTWSASTSANGTVRATIGKSTGKWYWENTSSAGSFLQNSIALSTVAVTAELFNKVGAVVYRSDGSVTKDNVVVTSGLATYTSGDVMGMAFDADAGTLAYYKNNTLIYTVTGISAGTYYPAMAQGSGSVATATVNFGATAFTYTPPSGYIAIPPTTYQISDPQTFSTINTLISTSLNSPTGVSPSTFTRASAATVVDFEGVVRTTKSGEARMSGMRRVENLYANSTTLGTQGVTTVAGQYLVSFYGTGSVTLSGTATGTLAGTGASNRVYLLVTTTAGTLTSTVTGSCTSAQLENVTSQSVQTPGEYVSTGVLSSPYQGAGVDGVQYFNTTLGGSAITGGGYLNEPSRVNGIRNNSMTGAAAGTPGTLPTNWTSSTQNGLSWNVVSVGAEGSMPYIDLRLSGTASATTVNTILSEATNSIAATVGQVFVVSQFVKIIAGTTTNLTAFKTIVGQSNTGSGIQAAPGVLVTTPSSIPTTGTLASSRLQISAAMAASSAFLVPYFQVESGTGAVDVTFRVGGNQAESGASATTYIATTTAAVTRAADSLTTPVVASVTQGTWVVSLTASGADTSVRYPGVALRGAANTNAFGIYFAPGLTASSLNIRSNGIVIADQQIITSPTVGVKYTAVVSWNSAIAKCWVNGVLAYSGTGITMPLSLATLAAAYDNEWLGNITNQCVYSTALPDATCLQLSNG